MLQIIVNITQQNFLYMGGGQDKPAWTACPPGVKITRAGGKISRDNLPPGGASCPGGKINWDTGKDEVYLGSSIPRLVGDQVSGFFLNHVFPTTSLLANAYSNILSPSVFLFPMVWPPCTSSNPVDWDPMCHSSHHRQWAILKLGF